MKLHGCPWSVEGSGARVLGSLWTSVDPCGIWWHPENPCAAGLDPPNMKISDSGGLDLEAWCLDAWMLEGLEWIGGGDGGDSILGRGDWKKFSHARASGARQICFKSIASVSRQCSISLAGLWGQVDNWIQNGSGWTQGLRTPSKLIAFSEDVTEATIQ